MKPTLFLLAAGLLASAPLHAAAVKDREGAVRADKAKMENDARWRYNDVDSGFAEARRTGKPLLVVLRCIPCLACVGLDAAVLTEPALAPLLDQFVCVRLINANAIDLARFQFDYDLSFSTLFFNADGTLYGRYGSWVHQVDPDAKETIGYRKALEGALALHRGYPANRAGLAAKQGGPTPFRTPVEIPDLAKKYGRELNWGGNVVQSCVHCHQVGDAIRTSYRDQGKPVPEEWVYPFPKPETIGLTLAPDRASRVESVAAGSIAAGAGVKAGDELVSLGGQPLVSPADVSWVLHRFSGSGKLPAVVKRGSMAGNVRLTLPQGWRATADISRRVGTWSMRGMALGGLVLEEPTDEERAKLGIAKDRMALRAKGVGQYGKHAAAKNAGFQKEDVITELGGSSARMTEGALIGKLIKEHKPGEKVKTTVLRGGKKVELSLPIQ